MVRSRLPFPSLLRLFGALLMLFPDAELEYIRDLSTGQDNVLKALACAVVEHNQKRVESTNYFKTLTLGRARFQSLDPSEYRLEVEMVKTACRKEFYPKLRYNEIQKCLRLPRNRKGDRYTVLLNYKCDWICTCPS